VSYYNSHDPVLETFWSLEHRLMKKVQTLRKTEENRRLLINAKYFYCAKISSHLEPDEST
jgi:hypothetical protein